jgi:hypothetical protein
MKELQIIQAKLKAPKGQFNAFGKYKYRSAEDILEAVKPIYIEQNCVLTISDSIELIGDRYYVKATARLTNSEGAYFEASAYAREDLTKKGMDESQITGSTSSYARKYALNGLFAIDDNKDSDYTNTHGKDASNGTSATANANTAPQSAPPVDEAQLAIAIDDVMRSKGRPQIGEARKNWGCFVGNPKFDEAVKIMCLKYPKE